MRTILGEQERPEGCLSDLTLDRWFSRELSPEKSGEAEAHLRGCQRCRGRHDELSTERAVFLEERPWAGPPSRLVRKNPRPLWALAPALAAAAAVTLWFVRPREPAGDAIRLKGTEHVGYFVEHAQSAERGSRDRPVHPGERIRFTYTSAAPVHLAIYGFDASGVASVYFPAAETAVRLAPGSDVPVSTAVELDGVLGEERILALFCDAAFRVEPHRAALERRRTLEAPAGCRLEAFGWRKEPPRR